MRKKFPKVKKFVRECLEKGVTSPSEMAREYNSKHGLEGKKEAKKPCAFTKAMRRMGISADKRLELAHEALKEKEIKDIEEYEEVQRYLGFSTLQQVSSHFKKRTVRYLRELWELMGKTNPRTWKLDPNAPDDENLIKVLVKRVGQDEQGQWKQRSLMLELLGAYNRTFTGRLPKNWSVGIKRPAGELKDFLEPDEYKEFDDKLEDRPEISREGQQALFSAQISGAFREGSDATSLKARTGVLSLKWEDINYKTKRCKIHEKGKRGQPAILWINVPLDLFPWPHSWAKLMLWHTQCFDYLPTQQRHATGRVFPISYKVYSDIFHDTRHRCNSRIKQDTETMKPHIFRKTHAQWAKRIGVSLENLCGDTSTYPHDGRYGVGWSDPKVPLKYYLTKEAWEYEEQDEKIAKRLEKMRQPLTVEVPMI